MKPTLKLIKFINGIALLFLIIGAYGLALTGILQVAAAVLFIITFPKNKLIYYYFGLVAIFFLIWNRKDIDLTFVIPVFLIGFLTYIIYTQKNTHHENARKPNLVL